MKFIMMVSPFSGGEYMRLVIGGDSSEELN